MDSTDLDPSSAYKKRAASVLLSAVEEVDSELLNSSDKPIAFQTKFLQRHLIYDHMNKLLLNHEDYRRL